MAADYLNYVLSNPDLRENAEALGLTQAEMKAWGETHWEKHGSKEGADGQGRRNSPTETIWESGFTETLGKQHYSHPTWGDRTAEDILQGSVRAKAESDMWKARKAIDEDWNLGQYTSEGWNMASDNPYRTGILGDTIEVNEGLGQLTPTTGGNQNFIQDRYVDASLANDFPTEWVTDNVWTGPENLGGYWDDLTNATRDAGGNLVRATPYDASTALRASTNVGNRGLTRANVGGGLLGNMYESTYSPRGLLDWSDYQTDPDFVLQENNMANYQPWAAGMGALPVYGAGTGTSNYVNNTTSGGAYTPVMDTTTTNTGTGNITTDAQGKTWIMSNGQWIPTTSDLGSILAAGDTSRHPFGHYDSNGMWIGAAGLDINSAGIAVNPDGTPRWSPTANFGILGTTGPFGNAGYSPEDNAAAAAAANEIYGSQVGMG